MKLFIPTIGNQIKLISDWTFTVYYESRNYGFMGAIGAKQSYSRREPPFQHTLPAGTVLKIERIYIRGNYRDYDSITFRVVGMKNARFWVKLHDANNIEYENVEHIQ